MQKTVPFTDVVEFQEGPGVRNYQYTNEGVKLLNVANFVNGNIDLSTSDRYISKDEAYGRYKHFLVNEGDFIIASSGIQVDYFDKKMGFAKKEHLPLCMNTSTIRFRCIKADVMDIRYFMYYLKSEAFKQQLFRQITGSAQLNFGPSHLKKMHIQLVDMNKQKKIINSLSKLEELISATNFQLAKLDELVKAKFVEMFGDPVVNEKKWNFVALNQISQLGSSKRIFEKEYVSEGIPFYRTKEIVELAAGHNISIELYIASERYEDIKAKYGVPENGDLLISAVGTIGKIWIADSRQFYFKDGNLLIFKASKKFNSVFMKYLLSELIKNYKRSMSSGTAYSALTIVGLGKMQIFDIPVELQNKFAEYVCKVDGIKDNVRKSLNNLETLKKSLMQEYFG